MTWVLTLHLLGAMTSVSCGAPSARLLARAERDELIRERDRLLREVRPDVGPPPGVERWAPVDATVVLAQF